MLSLLGLYPDRDRWCSRLSSLSSAYDLRDTVCFWCSMLLVTYAFGDSCFWWSMLLVTYASGVLYLWCLMPLVTYAFGVLCYDFFVLWFWCFLVWSLYSSLSLSLNLVFYVLGLIVVCSWCFYALGVSMLLVLLWFGLFVLMLWCCSDLVSLFWCFGVAML